MIEKNILEISADNKYLEIDVQVPDNEAYVNVNIQSIAFVTQDNYTIGYPNDPAKIELEVTADFPIEEYAITDPKHYKAIIPDTLLDLHKNMYFVYVLTTGAPTIEVSCGCDTNPSIFPVANLLPLHYLKKNYYNNYLNNCKESRANILDLILKEDAFYNAIKLCDYTLAIKMYKESIRPDLDKCLYLSPGCGYKTRSCGC